MVRGSLLFPFPDLSLTSFRTAMHYLHSKETSIVHRDLKLSNVLVDKNWCCKVSDFGVAKTLDKKAQTATIKGTPIYLAPESISVGRFSEKTDVFSFGITLWELWAQQRAYEDVDGSTANLLYRIAIEGLRPPIQADCPPRLATLMREIFSSDPDQRPTFTEVRAQRLLIS
jgi:serine/threonine protein kinase